MSYMGIVETYFYIKKYDEAFKVGDELIELKKQHNQDYSKEERKLERFKGLVNDKKLTQLQKEGEKLYYAKKYDEASELLKEAIELGSNRYQVFKCLSDIYIRDKDFDSAIEVLNVGIERVDSQFIHNDRGNGLKDILDEVIEKQ